MEVPLAVSIHDDPVEILAEKTHPRWLRQAFASEFERTLKAASSWGVISPGMAAEYSAQYGIQCELLYMGVETDQCLPPVYFDPSKTTFTIGSVGSVVSEANWTMLIDAVRQLGGKYPNRRFRILHLGDLPDHLHAPEVEVKGWITGQKFREHLTEFDISFLNFWFDSHESSRRIAFPTKAHSYIEAQRPILAFGPADCSVVRFVQDHQCGAACTVPNSQALTKCVEAFLDSVLYDRSVKNMLTLKQTFSRQAFYQHFERFIMRAMGG
jgi:glycosyltransferase involved in cell wall biosynthesis